MSLLTATEAATFADLAYDTASATESSNTKWRAQGSLAAAHRQGHLSGFTTNAGFTGDSGAFHMRDVSGFGAVFERHAQDKELVIAFRGTVSALDWISNLNIGMEPGPGGAIVHSGFNRVYRSVEDELHGIIHRAKPSVLHFVGHSLGGSMATLAMADYGLSGGHTCHLYTFGTPRIGGFGLNSQLRRVLTPSTVRRVYSVSDPVPMIPLLPYMHLETGATGLDFGFSYISAKSHDRVTYRNRMPANGWPAPTPLATKSDPDYWLAIAERQPGLTGIGLRALSMALSGIMTMLNLGSLGLSSGITVLDRLIEAIRQAALLSKRISEITLRFVKAALAMIGQTATRAAVTAADLTAEFLNRVFDMLLAPIRNAATLALARHGA